MNSLGERLRYAREKLGLSQGGLAEKLGVSQQAVQNVETGRARKPRYLFEASRILGVSYDWLLFGVDEQRAFSAQRSKRSSFSAVFEAQPIVPDSQIKVLDVARIEGELFGLTGGIADYVPRPRLLDGVDQAYAIYVQDAYMAPRYQEGELVFTHPGKPLREQDFVLVQRRVSNGASDVVVSLGQLLQKPSNGDECYIFKILNPDRRIKINKGLVVAIHKIVFTQQ